MTQLPTVSILIINWNTRDLLAACLRSIERHAPELQAEVIVVDNASADDSVAIVRRDFPTVTVIENRDNVGFARANNQAARVARGEYIFLLNSDAELLAGSLQALLALAQAQPRAGILGAHLVNPDGSFQASHTAFPTLGREFLILSGLGRLFFGRWFPSHGPQTGRGPQTTDYAEGAALLARKDTYLQLNGLDEGFFMYAEEVDLCYRFKQTGWQVWYHPEARILHHGGASSAGRRTAREGDLYRSRVQFFRKHYGALAASALKAMIYTFTAIKLFVHAGLRLLSGGKRGRPVITLKDLAAKLDGA